MKNWEGRDRCSESRKLVLLAFGLNLYPQAASYKA